MPSGAFRELVVQLKYYEGKRVIRNIERVSKPGLRTYQRSQDLKKVLGGQDFDSVDFTWSHVGQGMSLTQNCGEVLAKYGEPVKRNICHVSVDVQSKSLSL